MRAKLANAYVRAGGDDEKAARILGVTVGSARLAKKRYLDRPWRKDCPGAQGAFMPVRGAVFLDVADKDVPAVVEARTGQ